MTERFDCNKITSNDHQCLGTDCKHWNHEIDNCPVRRFGCISKRGIIVYCVDCKRSGMEDSCLNWRFNNRRTLFIEVDGVQYKSLSCHGAPLVEIKEE